MRLSVAVPAVVLMIASALLGLGLTAAGQASEARRRAEAVSRSGVDILNAHACGEGETKQILVLGIEDGFSPVGTESGFIRPGRVYSRFLPGDGSGEYDQVNVDRHLADSFKVEGPVSGGVFLIRSRRLNTSDSENDSLNFGALGGDPSDAGEAWIGGGFLAGPRRGEGWSIEGDSIYANLDDIELRNWSDVRFPADASVRGPVQSLKDFLNRGGDGRWLDVAIGDDTAVDFMGLALCRPPPVRKGMTLTPFRPEGPEQSGRIHLSCHHSRGGEPACNPYIGDTACSAKLPVACLKPGDLPAPVFPSGAIVTGAWSGGDIAVTEPVSGDRFRSVQEVEAFCARRFGDDWRVATLHDGRYQSVSGRGDPETVPARVWVDIADQPHGVCWARE